MNRVVLLMLFTIGLLSGCSSTNLTKSENTTPALVLATPLQVAYAEEVALARFGQMISSGEYEGEQLAQIYYERGIVFDRVGLKALARFDFNRAIQIKPDFVQAYNFLGVYYTMTQDFDNAYEAFDSAIELAPEYDFAYFSRALALYYAHKFELADQEIEAYYAMDPNDPYRVLWRYILNEPLHSEVALEQLRVDYQRYARAVSESDMDLIDRSHQWGWTIVAYYAGLLSEQEFIVLATDVRVDNQRLAERLCEAYFYMGKLAQQHQHVQLASSYFRLALASNVYEFVEHRYSLLELDKILEEANISQQSVL